MTGVFLEDARLQMISPESAAPAVSPDSVRGQFRDESRSDNASEWETERGQSVKKALMCTGLFDVGREIKAPAFKDPHHTPNANDGAFIMDTADFFHHFRSVNCCSPIEFSFGRGSHAEYKVKLDAENAAADMGERRQAGVS